MIKCNVFIAISFIIFFEEGNESPVTWEREFQQREEELKKEEVEVQIRENELLHAREEIHKREEGIPKRVLVLLNE